MDPHEMPAFLERPAQRADVDAICELIRSYSVHVLGVGTDARNNLETTWNQLGFHLQRDTRLVTTTEGRVIGYAEVQDTEAAHVRIGSWMRVHPEYRGRGLETALLHWIEQRARQAIDLAPAGARVALIQALPEADALSRGVLDRGGFTVMRHFWRMVIDLAQDIPEPNWPLGMTVRTLDRSRDLPDVVRTYQDAFRDHWGHINAPFEEEVERWEHWFSSDPQFDPSLVFLACAGQELAGIAKCSPRHADDADMGFVNVLGVRRAWRRQGVASALLRHAFRTFRERGKARVGLGVDSASLTGAVELYRSVGMAPTVRLDILEKELRAGSDLRVQSLASDAADA